jgi:phytoene dehydrogenase-like protein
MAKEVLVCGAGWAGLNAARILRGSGHSVKVLEKSDRVGGRITSDYLDGFTLDRGFQVVNPAYSELRECGVLNKIQISPLPKGLEIRRDFETIRVGDFRTDFRYLLGDLGGKSGKLTEKLAFLKYLYATTEDISFGAALTEAGSFYENVLRPFLTGVFLNEPDAISNRTARELIHWFIKGRPGLPVGGVAVVSEALASDIEIEFGVTVEEVSTNQVRTDSGAYQSDAVIVATDPITSARLLGESAPALSYCQTWYFSAPVGQIQSRHLRVGGIGPVINTVVLSNVEPSYAPPERSLIAATSLIEAKEEEIRDHLSYLWEEGIADWELVSRVAVPGALPLKFPGEELVRSTRTESGVYRAGDWLSIPAQQGALLSGRLAAMEVLSALTGR